MIGVNDLLQYFCAPRHIMGRVVVTSSHDEVTISILGNNSHEFVKGTFTAEEAWTFSAGVARAAVRAGFRQEPSPEPVNLSDIDEST